jgi:hypothetical protein
MALPAEILKRLEVLEANSQKNFVNLSLSDGRHIKLKLPDLYDPLSAAIHNENRHYKKYIMQVVDMGADGERIIILAQAIWKSYAMDEEAV